MLVAQFEDARSAAALACGPLDRLASQGRRFRPSVSLASRKGAPRPQWFRDAFDCLVRVSKERDYGLKLGARPAAKHLPDFLRVRMVEGARAHWKLRSGVPEIGDGLSLAECELLGRQVVRDLSDADPHIARMATLAALVYSAECPLYVLRHIPIGAAAGCPAWVSAGLSQFRVDMAGLRTRLEDCGNPGLFLRTTTVSGSSLPRELGEQLNSIAERREPAKSIGELLDIDDSTAAELQEYLRSARRPRGA